MTRQLIVFVGITLLSRAALAQYAVQELVPPPGGSDTIASAIDQQGRIVGSSLLPTGRVAVLWESAGAMPLVLGTLEGGARSEAVAIAGGLVVGTGDRDCGTPGAFLWTAASGIVRIGPDTCAPTPAVGVNGSGQVLMQVGDPPLPLVWPLGGGLPGVPETWGQSADVTGIDAQGRVLGSSAHHPEAERLTRAIEWRTARTPRLHARLAPGARGADAAVDRNASGVIVGFARLGSVTRAAVWNAAGQPTDAGAALGPAVRSQLYSINESNLAVGNSAMGAILWSTADGARVLETMLDQTGDGWILTDARGINDAGLIVGNGTSPTGRTRGFVLLPGGAACQADLDGDGALTIFDFLAFQNLFDSGDPRADFDGDGELTIFDFLAFQNEFDAGC